MGNSPWGCFRSGRMVEAVVRYVYSLEYSTHGDEMRFVKERCMYTPAFHGLHYSLQRPSKLGQAQLMKSDLEEQVICGKVYLMDENDDLARKLLIREYEKMLEVENGRYGFALSQASLIFSEIGKHS